MRRFCQVVWHPALTALLSCLQWLVILQPAVRRDPRRAGAGVVARHLRLGARPARTGRRASRGGVGGQQRQQRAVGDAADDGGAIAGALPVQRRLKGKMEYTQPAARTKASCCVRRAQIATMPCVLRLLCVSSADEGTHCRDRGRSSRVGGADADVSRAPRPWRCSGARSRSPTPGWWRCKRRRVRFTQRFVSAGARRSRRFRLHCRAAAAMSRGARRASGSQPSPLRAACGGGASAWLRLARLRSNALSRASPAQRTPAATPARGERC